MSQLPPLFPNIPKQLGDTTATKPREIVLKVEGLPAKTKVTLTDTDSNAELTSTTL